MVRKQKSSSASHKSSSAGVNSHVPALGHAWIPSVSPRLGHKHLQDFNACTQRKAGAPGTEVACSSGYNLTRIITMNRVLPLL